jgi:hypothetical protein
MDQIAPYATPPAAGSDPGWETGYVPPAAEWNDWWSRKVDVGDASLIGGPFLSLNGGTLVGPLYLPTAMPTDPTQAVNKAYVDSLTFATGPFMPMAGGTFSGPVTMQAPLTLPGNPASALQAAPKQYVDSTTAVANNALTVAQAAVRRAGDSMTGALVLVGDPTAPLGAVTKQYADAKFLPAAGGTVSGSLTVGADLVVDRYLYCTSLFYVNAFNGWEWQMYADASGNKIQLYRNQWYDIWNGTNGTRSWIGGNQDLMNLDGSGNLNILGSFSAAVNISASNQVYAGGNLVAQNSMIAYQNASVAGTLTATAFGMGQWVFYNNGNQIQQHTSGWYDQWVVADGTRNWVGGNVVQMTLSPGGNLSVVADISAGNNVFANGSVVASNDVFALGGGMSLAAGGSGRIVNIAANWYFDWNSSNGNLWWIGAGGGIFQWRATDGLCFANQNAVGGMGAYLNLSDERGKSAIRPAAHGLAAVLQLEPIEFSRILKSETRKAPREVGFSAQQVRRILPTAVRAIGIELADGSGGLDSAEPSLAIMIEPVVAALVNGMKELAAEVAALKAAR